MTTLHVPIPAIADIESAAHRVRDFVLRIAMPQLQAAQARGPVWLKLENLQPVGCFKLRGAANALLSIPADRLSRGVYTASAGNMAQGVAWVAREMGVACRFVVPEAAPNAKTDAVERLGGVVVRVPYEDWWQTIITGSHPGESGHFVHPVFDADVLAGNGTIGLEIAEECPEARAIFVPYGGGALALGIAAALKARLPQARVIGCETEAGAPLAAALRAGVPTVVEYHKTFVDGIGSPSVLEAIWPAVRELVGTAAVVSLDEVEDAIRLLVDRHHVVAEGAGASSVAAALAERRDDAFPAVCVVSGGHLNRSELLRILAGGS
jgi:threonine dehydratase